MSNVDIYGLIDPRDREIKYVGQTNNLMRRLKQHLADRGDTTKCDWIKELHLQGMKPQLVRLDTTTKEEAHAVENWWILFCRHQGWQNVNGTNPDEWRADFGEMFSEDLERQYQEYVARLESAESAEIVKRENKILALSKKVERAKLEHECLIASHADKLREAVVSKDKEKQEAVSKKEHEFTHQRVMGIFYVFFVTGISGAILLALGLILGDNEVISANASSIFMGASAPLMFTGSAITVWMKVSRYRNKNLWGLQ